MTSSKAISVVIMLLQVLARITGDSAAPSGFENEDIVLVNYGVLPNGSSPAVCTAGRRFLDGLAGRAKDAQMFSDAAADPTYGGLMTSIFHHQRRVYYFVTTLWIWFFIIIAFVMVIILLRITRRCGGSRTQRVTGCYMPAYVLYVVGLALLSVAMISLLVSIISTKDAVTRSLVEKAPHMKMMVFSNLRAYVKETAEQMAQLSNQNTTRKTVDQTARYLTSGFSASFQRFVRGKYLTDVKTQGYHVVQECAKDISHLGRLMAGEGIPELSKAFADIASECAARSEQQEHLFRCTARHVADTTAAQRSRIAQVLVHNAKSAALPTMDEDGARTTLNGIDEMDYKLHEFEAKHGVYYFLSHTVTFLLLGLMLLLLISVGTLFSTLVISLSIHNQSVKPYERKAYSHVVGYMFVATALLFTSYALLAIPMAILLTAYGTLPECYLCAPHRSGRYHVLDDALGRLWPASERSELFARLTPSKVFSKCTDESVSILDLPGSSSRRRKVYKLDDQLHADALLDPPCLLQMLSNRQDPNNQSSLVWTLRHALRNMSAIANLEVSSNLVRDMYKKWSRIEVMDLEEPMPSSIVTDLLAMVSSYYSDFLKHATGEVERLLLDFSQVVGPCYIAYSVMKSIIDVTCGMFTTELVGHWCALLIAIVLSLFIIPLTLGISKYFFRTQRPVMNKKVAHKVGKAPYKSDTTSSNAIPQLSSSIGMEALQGSAMPPVSPVEGEKPSSIGKTSVPTQTSGIAIAVGQDQYGQQTARPLEEARIMSSPAVSGFEGGRSLPATPFRQKVPVFSQTVLTEVRRQPRREPQWPEVPTEFVVQGEQLERSSLVDSPVVTPPVLRCQHTVPSTQPRSQRPTRFDSHLVVHEVESELPPAIYSHATAVSSTHCHHTAQSPQPTQLIIQPSPPSQPVVVPPLLVIQPPAQPQIVQSHVTVQSLPPQSAVCLSSSAPWVSSKNQQAPSALTAINFFGSPGGCCLTNSPVYNVASLESMQAVPYHHHGHVTQSVDRVTSHTHGHMSYC